MTHDEMIDVIMHHKNGGRVECLNRSADDDRWIAIKNPAWNFSDCDYRPKPEPMKIYAEICDKKGILMRTSKVPIDRIYSGTIIKTFIEAP
jgi:hypothetical protein